MCKHISAIVHLVGKQKHVWHWWSGLTVTRGYGLDFDSHFSGVFWSCTRQHSSLPAVCLSAPPADVLSCLSVSLSGSLRATPTSITQSRDSTSAPDFQNKRQVQLQDSSEARDRLFWLLRILHDYILHRKNHLFNWFSSVELKPCWSVL